jgi:hypothetical protein
MNPIFILCTGSSLNSITKEEKEYIDSCNHICVNRFPVFWKQLDIKPKKYIFLDENKTQQIARSSIINNSQLDIITSIEIKEIFEECNAKLDNRCKITYTLVNMARNRKKFVDLMDRNTSLFWSSILGSAVNACTILYPGCDIKILGMDGGKNMHFWTGHSNNRQLDHSSIGKDHNSMNMLNWGLPIINKECKARGIKVRCCNKESEWVKNQYIEYESIL